MKALVWDVSEAIGDEVFGYWHRSASVRRSKLHRHAVFEVQQVGGRHLLIQFQAFGDRVQIVLKLAHRDWRLQGELRIRRKLAGLNAQLQPF